MWSILFLFFYFANREECQELISPDILDFLFTQSGLLWVKTTEHLKRVPPLFWALWRTQKCTTMSHHQVPPDVSEETMISTPWSRKREIHIAVLGYSWWSNSLLKVRRLLKKTIIKKVAQYLGFKNQQNFHSMCRWRAGGKRTGKRTL